MLEDIARKKYEEYLEAGLKMSPPFKGFGMMFVQLAIDEPEMFHIKLDAILYFEAVGENVFAYTKGNVFDIKQRLYQIEEKVEYFSFVRASKSMLINLQKISSISSDSGGRGKIKLINGETVIASRAYIKNVTERLKDLAK